MLSKTIVICINKGTDIFFCCEVTRHPLPVYHDEIVDLDPLWTQRPGVDEVFTGQSDGVQRADT